MDIGRPPDDPNTCGVAGAQSLTGARNVLLHLSLIHISPVRETPAPAAPVSQEEKPDELDIDLLLEEIKRM